MKIFNGISPLQALMGAEERGTLFDPVPTPAPKRWLPPYGALLGTVPKPSASNRFVTESDPALPYLGTTPPKGDKYLWLNPQTGEISFGLGAYPVSSGSLKREKGPGQSAYANVSVQITNPTVIKLANLIQGTIPSGAIDGVNGTFVLPLAPAWLALFKNGMFMIENTDYTLSGKTIQYVDQQVPRSGANHFALYAQA